MTNNPISIYIHIPFCKTRCGYCDFLTCHGNTHLYKPYKDALIKEIAAYENLHHHTINTIFIGGGTPTVLPPDFLWEILEAVYKYPISPRAEISIEANPGTLNRVVLRTLKNAGVNRLSIGLQAWQNKVLKSIDRSHTLEDFVINYENARRLGFNNINLDLIFSLPYMKSEKLAFKNWRETLKNVATLNPEHISVYSLIIEENTPFYRAYEEGLLIPQSQEDDRRMYHFAGNYLGKKGYAQYEISNFAKRGKACTHNINYWKRGEYKGFGIGAHSFTKNQRYNNIKDIHQYISTSPKNIIEEKIFIDAKAAMEEFMFLGLRLTKGVKKEEFKETFSLEINEVFGKPIEENIKMGLLREEGGRLMLTKEGRDVSNRVMGEFLL